MGALLSVTGTSLVAQTSTDRQMRWAGPGFHGGLFWSTTTGLDLLRADSGQGGFAVLLAESDEDGLLVQVMGAGGPDALVLEGDRWSAWDTAERTRFEGVVRLMAAQLGGVDAGLAVEGRPLGAFATSPSRDVAGSVGSGLPRVSRDGSRGLVQVGWAEGARRYGVYGRLRPGRPSQGSPIHLDDFATFVGFAWSGPTERLEVITPGAYLVGGGVRPRSDATALVSDLDRGLETLVVPSSEGHPGGAR